jgi:Flp pilus assembly protein TadG
MGMRHNPEGQRGQTVVLIAIVLPVLLGIGALAVDVAHLYVQKRHTQNAVDAAALAGAAQLTPGVACGGAYNTSGTCQFNVSQAVQQYSNYNGGPNQVFAPCGGSSDTNCYVTPYVTSSDPSGVNHVQVRLKENATTWLIGALGISGSVNVSSSAAAAATPLTSTTVYPPVTNTNTITNTTVTAPPTTSYTTTYANDAAMFAMNPVCGSNNGVVVNGNSANINGPSTSNGSINVGGNPGTYLSYANYRHTAAGDCDAGTGVPAKVGTVTTHTNTFTTTPAPGDWPKWFDDAAICNNYISDAAKHVTVVTGAYTLPSNPTPGIYCNQAGSITLPNTDANVTLVANQVTIGGNNDIISAYTQGLLAYMTGTGTLNVNANGSAGASLTGYLFAPNADIAYNGNSGANGFYEAQNIRVLGNSFTITGNGPGGTPGTTTNVTSTPTTSYSYTTVTDTTSASTVTSTTGTSQGLDQ